MDPKPVFLRGGRRRFRLRRQRRLSLLVGKTPGKFRSRTADGTWVLCCSEQDLRAARAHLDDTVRHTLNLDVSIDHKMLPMDMSPHATGQGHAKPALRRIEWDDEMPGMNAASNDQHVVWKMTDTATGKSNMATTWTFKKGEFVKIRIHNDATPMHPMQHSIHFHGQRMLIAAVNGFRPENLGWKDSVLVAPGEDVDVLLEASNVGSWMAHCHIAEHLGAGMMMGFKVVD